MICGKCGYDRWDGVETHDYGGRESAGVKCWGPRHKVTQRALADTGTAATRQPAGPAVVDPGPPEPPEPGIGRQQRFTAALEEIEADLKLKRGSELAQPDPADRRGKRKAKPGRFSRKAKKVRR